MYKFSIADYRLSRRRNFAAETTAIFVYWLAYWLGGEYVSRIKWLSVLDLETAQRGSGCNRDDIIKATQTQGCSMLYNDFGISSRLIHYVCCNYFAVPLDPRARDKPPRYYRRASNLISAPIALDAWKLFHCTSISLLYLRFNEHDWFRRIYF